MNYQISMQLYDVEHTKPNVKEYIYSKVYSEDDVREELTRILNDIENNNVFVAFTKKDGELWVRSSEIRTLFVKPADPAYGT